MKKLIILSLSLIIVAFACKKGIEPSQITPITESHKKSPLLYSDCGDGCLDVSPPVVYSGLPESVIDSIKGFNIFSDHDYDAGWAEGCRDAAFYINEVATSQQVCVFQEKLKVAYNVNSTKIVNINYTLQPNEYVLGFILVKGCATSNWPLVRCALRAYCNYKSLLNQYEFNMYYSGTTNRQHTFDLARWTAYNNYTTHEPLSTPSGPY